MFKRKKKTSEAELPAESMNTEAVNVEQVAAQVAEEITVYESNDKKESTHSVVPDSPTIRIPVLKDLTDELVFQEAKELLEEYDAEAKTEKSEPTSCTEEANTDNASEDTISQTMENTVEITEDNNAPGPSALSSVEEKETDTPSADESSENAEETPEEPQKDVTPKKKKSQLPKKKKKSTFLRKKEFKHRVSLLANIIMWVVSLTLFVFCLSNLYQQILNKDNAVGFFNTGNAIVVSESMVPVLEKNDFIVYKTTPIEQLRQDDIVVYKRDVADGHILIVHRLVAITDGYAVTKGDNNSVQDDPFDAENIVGKVVFTVPQLGVVLDSLTSVAGLAVIFLLFVIITTLQFVYRKFSYNQWLKQLASNKEERQAVQLFLEM